MESPDKLCLVCHEHIDIYAIGPCDHPICFKCSTRMRALCDQFYCPICRTDLPEVFFLTTREKFSQMPVRKFILNRKLKIQFENEEVRRRFEQLLEHKCKICKDRYPEKNFKALRDHVRRVHQMFFCDLCLELKIFTRERKIYNRPDLATHRRVGDKDDKSYKGHPLCQFCDTRYLDKDELYKHLRKDHFYCHFCESLGTQEFYSDYENLREHFLSDHYLCEEGECATVQFTNAFRSSIDFKSHQALHHSKAQTKQQARLERTINIDINYARRPQRGGRGEDDVDGKQKGATRYQGAKGARGGRGKRFSNETSYREKQDIDRAIQASLSTMREENMKKDQPTGKGDSSSSEDEFSHTEENFPALGTSQPQPLSTATTTSLSASMTDSKPSLAKTLAMSSHMSVQHGQLDDFPTLASDNKRSENSKNEQPMKHSASSGMVRYGAKNLDDDFPELSTNVKPSATVQGTWTEPSRTDKKKVSSQNHKKKQAYSNTAMYNVSDFPVLGTPSNSANTTNWFRTNDQSKVNKFPVKELDNKADAENIIDRFSPVNVPDLPKTEKTKKKKKKDKVNEIKTEKVSIKGNSSLDDIAELLMSTSQPKEAESVEDSAAVSKPLLIKKKEDKVDLKLENQRKNSKEQKGKINQEPDMEKEKILNKEGEVVLDVAEYKPVNFVVADEFPALGTSSPPKKPPPGFRQGLESVPAKVPPGFAVKVSSHKLPPGFTPNSLGEMHAMDFPSNGITHNGAFPLSRELDNFKYRPPSDFTDRNQTLIGTIQSICEESLHFVHFKTLSGEFRRSDIDATEYYYKCQDLLSSKFLENIFPELIALLPDIDKQQELLSVYIKNMGKESKTSKSSSKGSSGKGAWTQTQSGFLTCPTCRQVLVRKDYNSHVSSHNLDSDFPALDSQ